MTQSHEKNIKWLLLQATIPVKQTLHKLAEKHGLTTMQLWTMNLLHSHDEIPMNSISQRLGCDASNVTGIADRLLDMGLIDRHEYSQDRRIKMIRLSKKGVKLRMKLLKELDESSIDSLERLNKEEQVILEKLLLKANQSEAD